MTPDDAGRTPPPAHPAPGGSPLDIRDAPRRGAPGTTAARPGEPVAGASAEDHAPGVTPDLPVSGWSAGGMALPALLVAVLLVAVIAAVV